MSHLTFTPKGGLGNQLFQLLTCLMFAKRSNVPVTLPGTLRNRQIVKMFNIHYPYSFFDGVPDNYIHEYTNLQTEIRLLDGINSIEGYRQNVNYFDDEEMITYDRPPIIDGDYIAVHIRGGDYNKWYNYYRPLRQLQHCGTLYYQTALAYIKTFAPDIPVYIVTDDIDYARTFNIEGHIQSESLENDFNVLYWAKYIIFPNSTFSWWAAYLGRQDIKICPSEWWLVGGVVGRFIIPNSNYHHSSFTLVNPVKGELVVKFEETPPRRESINIFKIIRGFLN